MGRKAKYSKEVKLSIVRRYLKGESASELASKYGLPNNGKKIYKWVHQYETNGPNVFDPTIKTKSYSKEFKIKIILEYLSGGISADDISNKYKIGSSSVVLTWVKKYNYGIEIKDYNPKNEAYIMKARKTTFEERLDIVKYVLANENDYKGASYKFFVPYASVYQWVSKYNQHGEESLSDRRGRPSTKGPVKEHTVEEKQTLEIEKLKRELEYKNMVIEVLKKNIELQEEMERNSRSFARRRNTKQ